MSRTQGSSRKWTNSIEKFSNSIEAVRQLDPTMPTNWLAALLLVSKHQNRQDGISIRELGSYLGLPYSSVAEIAKKLSAPGRRFTNALGLIEQEIDPNDERRKLLRLSKSGEELIQRIDTINR